MQISTRTRGRVRGYPLSPSESEVSQRDIAANAGGKDNSED